MKKERSKLEVMIGPGLAILLVLVGVGVYYLYRQPLGPALEDPKLSAPVMTEMSVPTQEIASVPEATDLPEAATVCQKPQTCLNLLARPPPCQSSQLR
jgi:hypothetical protein